jgi:chemotaxis protein methyltransferase CheR
VDVAQTDIEAFRSAIAREVGLRFDDDKLPLLAEVLAARMRSTDSRSAAAYVSRLGASELGEVARTITVNETYFLRYREQFAAVDAIVRAREAAGIRHLRMLSAGCSSGEEAYSLAITVCEALRDRRPWRISILGVDLNPAVLEKARAASYSSWALRDTPESIARRYFTQERGRYVLRDDVREMVRFEPQNLRQPTPGFWRPEAYDIVFCRNVLMYFMPDAAAEIVTGIARALVPGGLLFLGHAENLRGLSHAFHLRHTHATFYYERKGVVSEREVVVHDVRREPLPLDRSWPDAIDRASKRIEELATAAAPVPTAEPARRDLAAVLGLLQEERFHDALNVLDAAPSGIDPDALLLRATLFVSMGELDAAERACEALLRIDDLHAGAHYVMAICCEHRGDGSGAVEHSQAAAYLDGEFAMPHLQLGRIARRSGDVDTARRELSLALGLLPREDAGRILLFGGGFGREALVQLCRAELLACGGAR